jgi:predicted nucleic acid-binding protein
MAFVDTGACVAFFASVDPMHDVARGWFRRNSDRLITSDYVLDEVVTLLSARFSTQSAILAGESLLEERLATFIYLLPDDIERAWKIFRTHTDKGWSFTDCTSFALMQRLQISTVFAFDKHFAQMRGIRREPV